MQILFIYMKGDLSVKISFLYFYIPGVIILTAFDRFIVNGIDENLKWVGFAFAFWLIVGSYKSCQKFLIRDKSKMISRLPVLMFKSLIMVHTVLYYFSFFRGRSLF
tara:strand:+ start:155 stop:472 length:318 start_codon:yes stop_codon:yes gene_type:complete